MFEICLCNLYQSFCALYECEIINEYLRLKNIIEGFDKSYKIKLSLWMTSSYVMIFLSSWRLGLITVYELEPDLVSSQCNNE